MSEAGEAAMPRFAIVNTCDGPYKRMVCEWVDGVGYCYMDRIHDESLKKFDGMTPSRPTGMEVFGFRIVVGEKVAAFVQVSESSATYEDGKPRRWHDHHVDFILPLVELSRRAKTSAAKRSKGTA